MLFYEGKDSFLEEVVDFKKAKYVLLPIPMDITTTYLKGTKFGPRSIIEASRSLENYDNEFDFEVKNLIFTSGELEIPPNAEKAVEAIKSTVADVLLEKKFPILVGGEHTITYGASLAFDKDVLFVIFDAHADFKKEVLGSRVNHASNSRLVNQRNNIVLVGVRSLSQEDKKELKKRKIPTLFTPIKQLDTQLKDLKKAVSGRKVYISIDMDAFSPSAAPGIGTPQPGGIHYHEMLQYLETIIKTAELVGFDLTETRPLGENNITEILAAKLIIDIVALNETKKGN
jgi:agmatinase